MSEQKHLALRVIGQSVEPMPPGSRFTASLCLADRTILDSVSMQFNGEKWEAYFGEREEGEYWVVIERTDGGLKSIMGGQHYFHPALADVSLDVPVVIESPSPK